MGSRSLSEHSPLLFTCALFAALVVPALFMDGMFMDGVFYSSISRNFAEGDGSLWNMKYSDTYFPVMHEQPPLMFVLQGFFFKILGDSIFTERIYCVVAGIANTIALLQCWNIITGATEKKQSTSWLPLLLWVIMPVTFYAFINNLEECTMTFFVLMAFRSILKAILVSPEKNIHWILAGVWILAAGLTKGVQGMFLLSAPFWCWIVLQNGTFKEFMKRSVLVALVPVLFAVIAWLTPVIHDSFAAYFSSRFGKTFDGVTANSSNHFHILFELLIDTLPTMGVMFIFFIVGRKTDGLISQLKKNTRLILFILACGFSGILPLMVTLEQRGFYLVTALPILAIACALTIQPAAVRLTNYFSAKPVRRIILTGFGTLILAGTIVATILFAGKPKRDAENIAALHEIAAITGERQIVGCDPSIESDWPFMCYGQRYHKFSFVNLGDPRPTWFILRKGGSPPPNTAQISLNSLFFDLYMKSDSIDSRRSNDLLR